MRNLTFTSRYYLNESLKFIVVFILAVSFAACSNSSTDSSGGKNGESPPPSTADIQITVDNVGVSAWEVTDVEGDDGAAEENDENTAITLEIGQRYRFVNNGDAAHPFGLQDANDEYLLAQGNEAGIFENDEGVDFESDDNGITFTLTEDLAQTLRIYNCLNHGSMEGSIIIR